MYGHCTRVVTTRQVVKSLRQDKLSIKSSRQYQLFCGDEANMFFELFTTVQLFLVGQIEIKVQTQKCTINK